MNIGDAIRNSNSWHWLATTVACAAAASAFIPTYGWRDVLAYRDTTLAARERSLQGRLQEEKRVCAIDQEDLKKQTDKARAETAQAKAAFAAYGMEELPTGDTAVFTAQSRINEALSRRKLRVVSSGAKVQEKSAAAKPVARVPFKMKTLDYKVTGDFRDMFMFFVSETHKKPNYCFKNISVTGDPEGMNLSFVLQVCYK